MLHLKKLYKITSNNSLTFEQKISQLLQLGAESFGLELGIISEINNDLYSVKYAISPDNSITLGATFPVQNTYCIHTLLANKAVSFHHAAKSNIAHHPCYLDFGLESYIGAPLVIEGQRYGTLNFSSSEPKLQAFSEAEHEFIEFLSHWIGNEIARNDKIELLQSQKKRMIDQQNILSEIGKLAGVGAWEMDLVNQSLFWSEATRMIHEVDDDYIPDLATAINFYKPGKNQECIQNLVNKAMVEGGHFGDEFEIITHTGKAKWVAAQGRAEIINGKCLRLYGAFQDITKQVYYREQLEKRHEELSSALKARSTFLANMSHEIRTPINGVIGALQVIDKNGLNENQQHFINLAQDSANSLLSQVNDVLDFAKIDSNQIELENTPFEVNQLLINCVEVFNISAQEKSVELCTDFSATDSIVVIADPTRLRQIYANLISNALKFTSRGQIKVQSTIKRLTKKKSVLSLSITDSGIGIAKQQLQNLFLPFRQADLSTTRKFGGTGLGLSISQNLAKLMNGEIKVRSTEGQGSTFTVEIEVSLQEGSSQTVDTELTTAQSKDLSKIKVLVVEDNDINQIVVSEMLKIKDVTHDLASDGLEALEKLDSEAQQNRFYDIILMDCQMPNMDGYQATESIRKLDSSIANTPIIALTANAMKGDREACIASGMNDYLSKPIEQDVLYAMLEKYS